MSAVIAYEAFWHGAMAARGHYKCTNCVLERLLKLKSDWCFPCGGIFMVSLVWLEGDAGIVVFIA